MAGLEWHCRLSNSPLDLLQPLPGHLQRTAHLSNKSTDVHHHLFGAEIVYLVSVPSFLPFSLAVEPSINFNNNLTISQN